MIKYDRLRYVDRNIFSYAKENHSQNKKSLKSTEILTGHFCHLYISELERIWMRRTDENETDGDTGKPFLSWTVFHERI